jgi:hypothetical protein
MRRPCSSSKAHFRKNPLLSALLEFVFDALIEIAGAVLPAAHDKLAEWRRSDSVQLRLIGWLAILLVLGMLAAIVWAAIVFLT